MVVYCDYGISKGMERGMKEAAKAGLLTEYRELFKGSKTTRNAK